MSWMRSTNSARVVGHVARGLDRLGQQPLAQVVLDRAGADAARVGQLAHLSRPFALTAGRGRRSQVAGHARNVPGCRRRAGHGAGLLQRRDVLGRVARAASTSSVCSPSAGPGASYLAGVRDSLIGMPSCFTGPAPGWSSSTTISRARTSSESSASSRSRTGSRQQSCSAANACPLGRACARGRSRSTSACASRAGRLELLLDQVLAPDAAAPRLPELRLERAERDPAVAARVGPIADEPARELELAALGHRAARRSSARRSSRARRARRRPSRRRRAGPRPSARARAARPGSRTPPSARRRRGPRSARPPGPAGRPRSPVRPSRPISPR